MAGTKRTRVSGKGLPISSEHVSDDGFIASDSDVPASKKTKTVASRTSTSKVSTSDSASNSEVFHDLSTGRQPRRVNVSEFKGKKLVNIREYYEKDGEMLPGKKVPNQPNLTDLTKQLGMLRDCLQGISLTAEQFAELLKALPDIKKALGYAEEDAAEDQDEAEKDPEVDGKKLTNEEASALRASRNHPGTFPIEANGTLYFVSEDVRGNLREYEERQEQFVIDYADSVTRYDPEVDGPREYYEVEEDYKEYGDDGKVVFSNAQEKMEVKPKKEREELAVEGIKLTKKEIDMIKKTRKHPNYILMEKKGRGMLPLQNNRYLEKAHHTGNFVAEWKEKLYFVDEDLVEKCHQPDEGHESWWKRIEEEDDVPEDIQEYDPETDEIRRIGVLTNRRPRRE